MKPALRLAVLRNMAFVSVASMLMGLPALAAPLYKCEINGALAFQDTPCPPLKAKQKIACADVDGFANYQDTLDQACANLPAGTAKNSDFSADKKSKSVKPAETLATRKKSANKTTKDVFVRGYTKEDGTKVPSYTRSLPGEKRPE